MAKDTSKPIFQNDFTHILLVQDSLYEQNIVKKSFKRSKTGNDTARTLKNEFDITRKLEIEGIRKALAFENNESPCLLLEYIAGKNLEEILNESSLSIQEVLDIGISLCRILHELHKKNIIHKNIEPSNIILEEGSGKVFLIGFSIAASINIHAELRRSPKQIEGNLAYISPEQTGRINRSIDIFSDYYSLGILLYQLFAKTLPFDSEDPLELIHAHIARNPPELNEVDELIPQAISDIVSKLLKKNPEERYQSAAGILYDLQQVSDALKDSKKLSSFKLGKEDHKMRFQIPDKLYGREAEKEKLFENFKAIDTGVPKLALVKGHSGIGKSALIAELQRPILASHGNFISGKYNEYQTNIPFEAFLQAFDSFIDMLLTEDEEKLTYWRNAILDAVEDKGKLFVEYLPKMEIIIGEQEELPRLGPTELQVIFHNTTKAFIKALSKKEHPLVIFLDDLQWVDRASLDMIRILMDIESEAHVLIVGAYRDNEVDEQHPLMKLVGELEKEGKQISNLSLGPLSTVSVETLISEASNNYSPESKSLAELSHEKTNGNPYFLKEFLKSISSKGLFTYNTENKHWQWDLEEVRGLNITENVADFMSGKVATLPFNTQQRLQYASVLGSKFSIKTLANLLNTDVSDLLESLLAAINEGYIIPDSYNYQSFLIASAQVESDIEFRFVHDRIREAFYAQIKESQLPAVHLKIAKTLEKEVTDLQEGNILFDIANHYTLGTALLTKPDERLKLAELFFQAGKKAVEGAAFGSAVSYFRDGIKLLPTDSWQNHYELTHALHETACEAARSVSLEAEIYEFGDPILTYAKDAVDKAKIYMIYILDLDEKSKAMEAVEMTITALADLGLPMKLKPSAGEVAINLLKAKIKLRNKSTEDLLALPKMTNKEAIAKMQIMYASYAIAYRAGLNNFYALSVFKSIFLSLEYGNAPESPMAYCLYGVINISGFNDLKTGVKFGELSQRLERSHESRKYFPFLSLGYYSVIHHLIDPASQAVEHYRVAREIAVDLGEPHLADTVYSSMIQQGFWLKESPRKIIKRATETDIDIMISNQQVYSNWVYIFYQTSANLMGEENKDSPWKLDGTYLIEKTHIPYFENSHEKPAHFCYHMASLFLALLFDKDELAFTHMESCKSLLPGVPGMYVFYMFQFYTSLLYLKQIETGKANDHVKEIRQFRKHSQRFSKMGSFNPNNFEGNIALLEAEYARCKGYHDLAVKAYSKAIRLMEEKEYDHESAITYELAARYYRSIEETNISTLYLTKAHEKWLAWGAVVKAEQLVNEFPELSSQSYTPNQNQGQSIDLNTVIQASTAISEQIVQEKLLSTLMSILLKNAGAQKGMLFELEGDQLGLLTWGDIEQGIRVLDSSSTAEISFPRSIVNYVARTGQELVIADAHSDERYARDPYILEEEVKSVLCLPIFRQDELNTILYLENKISSNVFTPARIELLRMLSSQIGISLENASLYENLEAKVEERTREIVKQKEATEEALESLKSTQSKLVESEKMASLGQLTAGIAHEINNPINFVKSNIDSLKLDIDDLKAILSAYREVKAENTEDKLKDATKLAEELDLNFLLTEIDKLIEDIKEGAIRTSDIVSGLRNFSRLDEDAFKFVDINKGIDSTLTLLNSQLRDKVKVHRDYAELELVECLPGKINQVLMNILTNSIQAITEKGDIFIKTEQNKEKVYISIKDTGTGMTDEVKNKIFEPFFTTKDVGEGTGLGLSISYGIIERHGGEITVNSTPSIGTEFIVSLPITQLSQDHG